MNMDEILLKKWDILWNHYKLQNECLEKRRNFLWIIEALIFAGWYHINNSKCSIDFNIAVVLSLAGLFISIIWVFILKRERRSILITEMSLREVEVDWNELGNNIQFNRFILDKELLKIGGEHKFKYKDDKIDKPGIFNKYSASGILSNLIPGSIAFLWMFIIYFTLGIIITFILITLIFLTWVIFTLHARRS